MRLRTSTNSFFRQGEAFFSFSLSFSFLFFFYLLFPLLHVLLPLFFFQPRLVCDKSCRCEIFLAQKTKKRHEKETPEGKFLEHEPRQGRYPLLCRPRKLSPVVENVKRKSKRSPKV